MEGYKDYKDLESYGKGLKRIMNQCEYLPSEMYSELENIIKLSNMLLEKITVAEKEAEDIKRQAYIEGYEAGKEEGLKEYVCVIEALTTRLSDLKERDLGNIKALFQQFIKRMANHISEKNTSFIKEYISYFINKIETQKAKIIISDKIYTKITDEIGSNNNIEIIVDPNLKPEQIFIDINGSLSDIGIDRFFEEISF